MPKVGLPDPLRLLVSRQGFGQMERRFGKAGSWHSKGRGAVRLGPAASEVTGIP